MKGRFKFVFLLLLLVLAYTFLYKIYLPRVNAFGCFDDCFNYMAGYFMTKGKTLYSEIFFNHQPLMAYFSFLIQSFFHPINIYELILRHRQFVFLFGLMFNLLIVWRFSLIGLGFVLVYEFSKFYLFSDRFLAEGVIVYPLVYMAGLIYYKIQQRKIFSFEYSLSAVLTWFVIFMREPYIPLAVFIYILILWGKKDYRPKIFSTTILFFLIMLILTMLPLKDYLFDVIIVNQTYTTKVFSKEIMVSFFYPVFLLFGGELNIFRYFLVALDLIFLSSFLLLLKISKRKALLGIIFLLLGLANLRPSPAGRVFYEAYHLIIWYGLFVFSLFFLVQELSDRYKKAKLIFLPLLMITFVYFLFSSQSYIQEKINSHEEFITNYGHFLEVGEVIKVLSDHDDTLFLDGYVDLIYWQADRLSPYKYSWFIPAMGGWSNFMREREEMFVSNPPDFYYGHETLNFSDLPPKIKDDYQQFYSNGKPTRLFIRKAKVSQISKEQWKKAKDWLYELP